MILFKNTNQITPLLRLPHGGVLSRSHIQSPYHLSSLPPSDLTSSPLVLAHSVPATLSSLLCLQPSAALPVASAQGTFPSCPHVSLLPTLCSPMSPSQCGLSRLPCLNVRCPSLSLSHCPAWFSSRALTPSNTCLFLVLFSAFTGAETIVSVSSCIPST